MTAHRPATVTWRLRNLNRAQLKQDDRLSAMTDCPQNIYTGTDRRRAHRRRSKPINCKTGIPPDAAHCFCVRGDSAVSDQTDCSSGSSRPKIRVSAQVHSRSTNLRHSSLFRLSTASISVQCPCNSALTSAHFQSSVSARRSWLSTLFSVAVRIGFRLSFASAIGKS